MEQIYQVDCTFETTGYMYVKAADEEQAKKIAQKLLDNGEGELTNDTGGGASTAEVAHLQPEAIAGVDTKNLAQSNTERYDEILLEEKE